MGTRAWAVLSLLIVTPLGFGLKLYEGPGQNWFNNYAAGALYVIFWCLVAFLFWPRLELITWIAVTVFAVTSLLEVLQLWHPRLLEGIRASFLGRTLIGTTFAWWDFAHYALGCALAWLWMRGILSVSSEPQR